MVGREVVNDVLKNVHFIKEIKENVHNHTFRPFDHLNGLFLHSLPLGADSRQILGKIWGVNFVLGQGVPKGGQKWLFFC